MKKQDIIKALKGASGNRGFITARQLADALGRGDAYQVKKEYLLELENMDGRYLVSDVAEVLQRRTAM